MACKAIAIVQARVSSTRLPGKVLKEINGKSLIEILFHRLSQAKKINRIRHNLDFPFGPTREDIIIYK